MLFPSDTSAGNKTRSAISEEEVKSFTAVLKTKYGIDFTNYEMNSLTRGFNRVLSKHRMSSTLDLWAHILKDREFLTVFIDDMTVNLTELFRNPEFWEDIIRILPEYGKSRKLNIWHAGCSSGEEVYTMAILLHELGLAQNAKIVGSDLSSRILAQAEAGDYSLNASRYAKSLQKVYPKLDITKYFQAEGDRFTVKKFLKQNITFMQHDLVKGKSPGVFDIIFCRNVMIYFDEQLKLKVLELFYHSLPPDALFVIGYYDMMPQGFGKYFSLLHASSRIYKRNTQLI